MKSKTKPSLALPTLLLATCALTEVAGAQCVNVLDVLSPPGVTAGFGSTVALSGDRILVSDPNAGTPDLGAVHVFERRLDEWIQVAEFVPADVATGEEFGEAVALSGGTAIVGAFRDGTAGTEAGSAYLFEQQGSSWVEVAELTASDAAPFQRFGFSVAIAGDVAVVGAPLDDGAGTDAGAAYVFERQGTAWGETAKLLATDAQAGDQLGVAVAVSGETVVVGAWLGGDVQPVAGAAYVFERVAGAWVQTARLTEPTPLGSATFGLAVDVSGDQLVVGAPGFPLIPPALPGAAYVFERQGPSWVGTGQLLAHDGMPFDQFGAAVSVSADQVLVGARFHDDGASVLGTAYVFERQPAGWTEIAAVPETGNFGKSVALEDGLGVVGRSSYAYVLSTKGPPCPALTGTPPALDLAAGGVHTLQVDAGASHAFELYLVLGTNAGTEPGLPIPGTGLVLPLEPSGYLSLTLSEPGAVVADSLGFLDLLGRGTASLTLPPGLPPDLAGLVLHHAYLVLDPATPQATGVSNAAPLALTLAP